MKNLNFTYLLRPFLVSLFLVSCSKEAENISPLSEQLSEIKSQTVKIPYAKEQELKAFSTNKNVVDYAISRKAALLDLIDFKKDICQNKELTLSDLPVVVYDNDNLPKYYEFIVLDDNKKEIGTITCFAKKETTDFTAYILPFVRDYSEKNSTVYSDMYPYSSEKTETSNLSAIRRLTEEEIKLQKEAEEFWENVGEPQQTNSNLFASFLKAWNEEYTIPQFNNENLLRTRWSGACGPAALAWLYRAYYTHYKSDYYPLHGEESDDILKFYKINNADASAYFYGESPLYKDLAEKCRVGYGMDPFKDATFPKRLREAVNDIFPNHILVGGISNQSFARKNIEANHPVVIMIRDGFQLHYVVGFGTKNRYNTYNFGLFKVRKVHTDSWIRVSDNGATIGKHGYYPYYMNTHAIIGKENLNTEVLLGK